MEDPQIKIRMPAKKVPIISILTGIYRKENDPSSSNHIIYNDIIISRVNIIGVVVFTDETEAKSSFQIDDGTGKITVRSFEPSTIIPGIRIGEIINVIGRPREFSNERYIVPEIIKKTNQDWMMLRKKENSSLLLKTEEILPLVENIIIEKDNNDSSSILNNRDKIIEYIKKHDTGNGVETENILQNLPIKNCEKIIEDMLKEGEIFENMPNRFKVLE